MSFASKHVCGHSGHQIAVMVGVSRYTVAEYLRRARCCRGQSVGCYADNAKGEPIGN